MDTIAETGNPAETKVGEESQGGQQKELTEQMDTSGGNKAVEAEEEEVKDKPGKIGEKKDEEKKEEKEGEERKEEEKEGQEKKGEEKKGEEKKVETEPDFEMLSNPARVLPAQVNT